MMTRREAISLLAAPVCLSETALSALFPPDWMNAVVAIGREVPDPDRPNENIWTTEASGFLFGTPAPSKGDQKLFYVHIVTAKHVFTSSDGPRSQIHFRFNSATGHSKSYSLNLASAVKKQLFFHPDADIAVLLIDAKIINRDNLAIHLFTESVIIRREKLNDEGISVGDTVFILGFPLGTNSPDRNYVIAKHGIVARLWSSVNPLETRSHLIDAMIFPGNSGGPVVTEPQMASVQGTKAVNRSVLLGVVISFEPYRDVAISMKTQRPRVVFEENSGLATIVPADIVLDAIQAQLNAATAKTGIP